MCGLCWLLVGGMFGGWNNVSPPRDDDGLHQGRREPPLPLDPYLVPQSYSTPRPYSTLPKTFAHSIFSDFTRAVIKVP
jgi:hypothetical protein